MAMEKFRFGNLPAPPSQYSPEHLRQAFRILEIYFNQLDSQTPNQANSYRADKFYGGEFIGDLTGDVTANTVDTNFLSAVQAYISAATINTLATNYARIQSLLNNRIISKDIMADNFYGGSFYGDGRFLQTPYNQFTSNQDQTGAVATATAVTFNVNDFPDSISIVSNSRITFGKKGVYLLTYSLSFTNPTNDRQKIDIWYRYKGTDIANSNSRFSIPQRKNNGVSSYLIAVTPYEIDVKADGDYVEIYWRVTDATVTMDHIPAVAASPGVTPAIPATPSAILTIQFISAQFPPVQRIAPLSVYGNGKIGAVTVTTNLG